MPIFTAEADGVAWEGRCIVMACILEEGGSILSWDNTNKPLDYIYRK